MSWTVALKESVIDDLRWFGRKDGRVLLDEAVIQRLESAQQADAAPDNAWIESR